MTFDVIGNMLVSFCHIVVIKPANKVKTIFPVFISLDIFLGFSCHVVLNKFLKCRFFTMVDVQACDLYFTYF